jgi:tetratricopeptide (TPR) repeat protein
VKSDNRTSARSDRASGKRIIVVATLVVFVGAAAGTFLYFPSIRDDSSAGAGTPAVTAIERPASEFTPAENEARAALAIEEERDPRSLGTAEALKRLALAHGHADHLAEAQAVYTRVLQLSRWIDPENLPGVDVPESLVRDFEKEKRTAAIEATWAHAYAKRREILGRKHALTVHALRQLAQATYDAGRYVQAEPLFLELDTLAGGFAFLPLNDDSLAERDQAVGNLNDVYRQLEKPRERAKVLARLFEAAEPDAWPGDLNTGDAIDIALLFHDTGAPKIARDVLRRATREWNGEGAQLVRKIALAWISGQPSEAEAIERELLARNPYSAVQATPITTSRASRLPPEQLFPETLDALSDLLAFYRRIDRLDHVARINGEISGFMAVAPSVPPTTTAALTRLAVTTRRAGFWDESEKYHLALIEHLKRAAQSEEREITYARMRLASIYQRQDRKAEAIELQREVVKRVTAERGEHDWYVMFHVRRLSESLTLQGDFAEAERITSELLRRSVSRRGLDCEATADTMEQLALIYRRQKKFSDAAQVLVELLPIEKRRLGAEHPGTLFVLRFLGDMRREQGRIAEACALHQRVLADLIRVHGLGHRDIADAFRALGNDYVAQQDFVRAAGVFLDATRQLPNSSKAWNTLAWFRATASKTEARDASAALTAAQKACDLSAWTEAACIDTLAAAHAEAGDFSRAVEFERQAIAQGETSERERTDWEARLALYLERKPYRQPAPAGAVSK